MTQNREKKKSAFSLVKRLSLILISLFILYVIAGFWVVPPLLKPRLENELSSQIGRKVTIGELKVNPLALSSTTANLNVYETDGKPFAGFEELFVDAQLSSIVKWALTFSEIRVVGPFCTLKLLPDKKLNIDDLLTKFSQPKQTPDHKADLPPAVISKLRVKDGKFSMQDSTGTEPIQETYSPITFTLENLSTLKERQGAYQLVGVGPSGLQYQLDGQLSVNPVRVQGSYSITGANLNQFWQHIKNQVSFQIVKGSIATSGNYSLEFIDGTLNAKLQNGEFELRDFQLTEKGQDQVLISLPSLFVQGISADLKTRDIIVERVKTADAKIVSWLAPDGTFKLQTLLLPDLQKLSEMKKSSSPEPKATASQPWYATVNRIEVTNWAAAIEDRTLPKPASFTFDNINATIDNLDNKKSSKAEVELALQINRAGTVKVIGSGGIDPLTADFKVSADKVALKSFQPYVDTAANVQIEAGTTGSDGRVFYQVKDNQSQIRYQGEMSVDGLEISDRLRTNDFIKLAQFKISGIALELLPNKLHAAQVLIDQPHARVTIDQNGTVNVVQAFAPEPKGVPKGEQNLLQRLVNFLILQIKGPMPTDIDLVELNNLTADFVDGSITPGYTTRLEITKGTVKGLSSDPSARGDFKIEGIIDRSATIEGAGKMNPMNALQYSEVDFSLKDFDLKSVSTYSGKFVGYKIDQGKLHLKLKYRVDDHTVNGNNIIYIDRLTLGEEVDSPDAPDLPLALGVALLKDQNGRITLEVPVGGDVKDPQFDIGHAIKSALTKTIDDAGSSPFSTIAEIDGFKGDELRFVDFAPGLSELNARETKKLKALAKFLNERTPLILGVVGTADRQLDWASISEKQTQAAEIGDNQKAAGEPQKDPANGQVVDDKQLAELAQMRAKQVQAYLTQVGKVAAKRIQLKPAQVKSAPNGDHGRVELLLSAQ